MSKPTERFQTMHPSSEELDRLRAGLLDATPAARAAMRAHLDACKECRVRAAFWPRVVAALDEAAGDRAAARDLALRRRRALQGIDTRSSRRPPIGLALAAGVAAAALGIGTLFLGQSKSPATQIAGAEAAADLYVDLDFYLWLLHKRADEDASPNG